MILRYRDGHDEETNPSGNQKFLYRTWLGRVFLRLLTRPFLTEFMGWFLNRRISKLKNKAFMKKAGINPEEYELDNIRCFNDLFKRKMKPGYRTIDPDPSILISPCDSRLRAYRLDNNAVFEIKDSYYRAGDLIQDEALARQYENGYFLIFRLDVTDYHRYVYIDDGHQERNIRIKGIFHTVNPIALEHYNFFKTNSREYTILHTENFGDVIQCEVGALMVGKISNNAENNTFRKGDEKGCFEFGGSTIVLMIKDVVDIDPDILDNTAEGIETRVLMGEHIGIRRH